jgi:hypothetical protein
MVVPVVAIPPSIEAGLAPYRDLFPRSETYQHILEYCTGLVVLDKPSINRLAACLVDGPAQSSINKALTRSPWSGEAVNERRLESIQKHHRGKGLTSAGLSTVRSALIPVERRRPRVSSGTGITSMDAIPTPFNW